MRVGLYFILFIFLFVISCNQENNNQSSISLAKNTQEKRMFNANETIKKKYFPIIVDWKEFNFFTSFLNDNYKKTSFKEALNSSNELSNLSKMLQDSVLPKQLDDISFKARLNLLHTECLRLYDMSLISSIKSKEVFYQVSKVFDAYSFVNAKINAVLEQQELERLYGDDIKFFKEKFVAKDSLKIEVTKQKPNKRLQNKSVRKDSKLLNKKKKLEFKEIKN